MHYLCYFILQIWSQIPNDMWMCSQCFGNIRSDTEPFYSTVGAVHLFSHKVHYLHAFLLSRICIQSHILPVVACKDCPGIWIQSLCGVWCVLLSIQYQSETWMMYSKITL